MKNQPKQKVQAAKETVITGHSMHMGKLIHATLHNAGMTKSEFARRIGTSPQNIFGIFKRKSIDSDLLVRASKVLNHDLTQYLNPFGKPSTETGTVSSIQDMKDTIAKQEQKIDMLERENSLLKEIYELRKGNKTKQ